MSARSVGAALLLALGAFRVSAARAEEAVDAAAAAGATGNVSGAGGAAGSADSALAPSSVLPVISAEKPGPSAASSEEATALAAASSDSFSSEDAVETEQQHRLDLYGFADLTYTRLLIPKSDPWNRFYFPSNSFAVGNFNLYLSSNLGDSWRALGEVRFMYLPNGATTADANTGDVKRTDTTVLDYAGFEEPIHWGAIRIERIWVEHEFSTLFKLQVGAFLTPYGIWNVDHGTPAIIGIRAPFAVADELFPAHQTGLQLYGNAFFDKEFPLSDGVFNATKRVYAFISYFDISARFESSNIDEI